PNVNAHHGTPAGPVLRAWKGRAPAPRSCAAFGTCRNWFVLVLAISGGRRDRFEKSLRRATMTDAHRIGRTSHGRTSVESEQKRNMAGFAARSVERSALINVKH